MSLYITSQFDGGAIDIIQATNPQHIQLKLRPDQGITGNAEFSQWFYFAVHVDHPQTISWSIINAHEAAYPQGWVDYQACASYDRKHWFRVPTHYENGILSIQHQASHHTIYYAYFEPYTWERHQNFIASIQTHPAICHQIIGLSVERRPLDLLFLKATQPQHKPKNIWITARQHPGETMAEWLMEGFIEGLLNPANPHAQQLLKNNNLYLIPNMNPDGSFRGNLRTNAHGINLNRAWLEPNITTSPEVYFTKEKIAEIGVDIFIDVHGDEALPYLFIEGCELLENFGSPEQQRHDKFIQALLNASPDFQTKTGYPLGADTKTNLSLGSKYIGHTYGCLSCTLELPFKDNANAPQTETGWNGERSKQFGLALLQTLNTITTQES